MWLGDSRSALPGGKNPVRRAATLFGFASWAKLLHRYPTATVSPFALLIPVSGLASGAIFLDEGLAPLQIVGALLVLAGLAENVFGASLRASLRR